MILLNICSEKRAREPPLNDRAGQNIYLTKQHTKKKTTTTMNVNEPLNRASMLLH